MRVWCVVVALAMVLSGCAENGEPALEEGDDAATGGTGNSTATPEGGAGQAPVAQLVADLLNGTAPLTVNLTLNGTDADGDNLTWVLLVVNGTYDPHAGGGAPAAAQGAGNGTSASGGNTTAGNGTTGNGTGNGTADVTAGPPGWPVPNGTQIANGSTLPAIVAHNLTQPGNFSMVLAVSDGQHTAISLVHLTVAAGGVAPGTFLRTEDMKWTNTFTAGAGPGIGVSCGSGVNANRVHTWDFTAAEEDGTPTVVQNVQIKLDSGTGVVDADLFFEAPDGKVIVSGTSSSADEQVSAAGPFEPGKYTVRAKGCVAANGSYTVTATADYVAA